MIACGPSMLSTRGSYGSEMPPQMHKNSVMHLFVSKIGIFMKPVTCQSQGRTTKKDFGEAYRVLVGMDPTVPKVTADPGGRDTLSQLCHGSFQLG